MEVILQPSGTDIHAEADSYHQRSQCDYTWKEQVYYVNANMYIIENIIKYELAAL